MEFLNARSKNHFRRMLIVVARKETDEVLKVVKHHFPELKKLNVEFQDYPSDELIRDGVNKERESYYDPDKQEITLFLFNIYEQANRTEVFKKRLGNSILTITGYLVGEDMLEEDC